MAKILCVDDDANVLSGLERVLGGEFEIITATHPLDGLEQLGARTDFQVVVCDMKMPVIDGVTFLTRAKRILPAASRVMLTGVPNLDCAVAAINQGAVFRFLTKPCPPRLLLDTMHAAVQQHLAGEARGASSQRPEEASRPSSSRASGGDGERPITFFARAGACPPSLLELGGPLADAAAGEHPAVADAAIRSGCLLAVVAADAETALAASRTLDAERMLTPPLQLLLKQAQSGKPTDPDDVETAAVFAARLAAATRKGTWIDYIFRLFSALRRLLSHRIIDEVHAALCHARANVGPLQLYVSILEFHGKSYGPADRCLLRRIQRCRALIMMGSRELVSPAR